MTLSAPALEATGSPVMVLIVKLFPVPVDPTHRTQDWKKGFGLEGLLRERKHVKVKMAQLIIRS